MADITVTVDIKLDGSNKTFVQDVLDNLSMVPTYKGDDAAD